MKILFEDILKAGGGNFDIFLMSDGEYISNEELNVLQFLHKESFIKEPIIMEWFPISISMDFIL